MKKDSDIAIIESVRGGNSQAFAQIVDRYGNMVYGLVLRIVANEADATELAQDTFIQAYTHLSTFRGDASLASWLYRIAYNAAISHLTRKHRASFVELNDRLADTLSDDDVDATLADTTEANLQLLEQALTQLLPDDRTAITLFYYENRSLREIAYVLSTTEGNVATRLHRARRRLSIIVKKLAYDHP